MELTTLRIKEFHPSMIYNRILSSEKNSRNGTKIVLIGKPLSGKSTAIKAILNSVKYIIPAGVAISGSEDFNHTFAKIFPDTFVYSKYDEKVLERFEQRQKIAVEHLDNPWAVCIVDDCTDTPSLFKKPIQQRLFKNGRQYQMLYMLSLQYSLDVNPAIRTSIDFTFIFREPNLKNRKNLYENYAGIIPDFSLFCQLMDELTGDFQCLIINNMSKSNNVEECVFYWKAPLLNDIKFGCDEFISFHEERYNKEFVNML